MRQSVQNRQGPVARIDLDLKAIRDEVDRVKRSEARGAPQAALRRLARLRRRIQRASGNRLVTGHWIALLHQLEAGIQSRSGDSRRAALSYLMAAAAAFLDAYAAIGLLTNSQWAAEEAATEAQVGAEAGRVSRIRKLDDRGARFLKNAGDMLNEQLVSSGLPPVIFGGRYPAKLAPRLPRSGAKPPRQR